MSLRRASLLGLAATTLGLAGCANTYTCSDYLSCKPEGGTEGGSHVDGRADSRTDSPTKHDGGTTDATADGLSHEASTPDTGKETGGDSNMCDPNGDPSTNPCAISEAVAVFVASAPTGSDAGVGTRTSPYSSIGEGIANAGGKRVYVCGGTYAEAVTVTANISAYGGFSAARDGATPVPQRLFNPGCRDMRSR